MKAKLTAGLLKKLAAETGKRLDVWDTEITGLVFRRNADGNGSFGVVYRKENGDRRRYALGSTEIMSVGQARAEASKVLMKVAVGEDPQGARAAARKAAKPSTLGGFVEGAYRDWVLETRKTGMEKIERIRGSFKDLWDKPLLEITPWDTVQWRAKRGKSSGGKKRSAATLNRDLAYLRAALSKAVLWGMLVENPLRNVKPEREDRTPRKRYLTEEEEARLMDAILAREVAIKAEWAKTDAWRVLNGYEPTGRQDLPFVDYFRPFVITALQTGLRWGELVALMWTDVYFTEGVVRVRGDIAKSSQTREVPMSDTLRDTLTAWRGCKGGDGLVFPSPLGGQLKDTRYLWNKTLAKAGIKNFRFHDCRHTFASRLVANGVDLYVVKQLLGHSSIAVTERYSHVSASLMRDAIGRLDTRKVINFPSQASSTGEEDKP